jgi:hypothetical protein
MMLVAAQAYLTSGLLYSPEISRFPSPYFDAEGRVRMQSRVMERWPGPAAVIELWERGKLRREGRIIVLVGAAAYHDPQLLPLYRRCIAYPGERTRQAAAYGYRDLIGDSVPNLAVELDDWTRHRFAFEMDRVAQTLQRHTLVQMWLQALLRTEDKRLPDFRSFAPERTAAECLKSVERLMRIEDLDDLTTAYQISEDRITKLGLLRLIEALSLSRFVIRPGTAEKGWGPNVYEQAMAGLDSAIEHWRRRGCRIDGERVVLENLAGMGAEVPGISAPEACWVWLNVLRGGDPGWRATAAKQLYDCGGPWIELSVLQAESADNLARRDRLLEWYRLTPGSRPRRPAPPPG